MRIQVVLFVFNRPDLLSIQIQTIRKFLKNNYEIVVIYDSIDFKYRKEFGEICKSLGVEIIYHKSFPGKTPNQYHGEVAQYAYNELTKRSGSECDLFLFLDHDMFMIDEFDLISYFGDSDVMGSSQQRGNVEYIWPRLMMFKYSSIKDIDFEFYPGVYFGESLDTGGGTCHILNKKRNKV